MRMEIRIMIELNDFNISQLQFKSLPSEEYIQGTKTVLMRLKEHV